MAVISPTHVKDHYSTFYEVPDEDSYDYSSNIPDECLACIFQSLGSGDRKRCSLVCRRWLWIEGQSRHRLSLNAQADLLSLVPTLFSRFDSVTKLALRCDRRSESIDDGTLILISLRCLKLTRLKLRACRGLTDAGLFEFAKNCKYLKKLSCGSCTFGGKGMNALLDNRAALFSHSLLSVVNLSSSKSNTALKSSNYSVSSIRLNRNNNAMRNNSRSFVVQCQAGRITQEEFTEMAWQAVVSSPEVAKENKHQIVETEHLMKALLEQKNGLARRIFSKAGVDNTRLLEATDKFINLQLKVLGESAGSMLGRDLEALIQQARDYKKEYNDSFVSVEHLVLGFARDKRFGKQLFKDFQISLKTLKNAVEAIRGSQTVIDKGISVKR